MKTMLFFCVNSERWTQEKLNATELCGMYLYKFMMRIINQLHIKHYFRPIVPSKIDAIWKCAARKPPIFRHKSTIFSYSALFLCFLDLNSSLASFNPNQFWIVNVLLRLSTCIIVVAYQKCTAYLKCFVFVFTKKNKENKKPFYLCHAVARRSHEPTISVQLTKCHKILVYTCVLKWHGIILITFELDLIAIITFLYVFYSKTFFIRRNTYHHSSVVSVLPYWNCLMRWWMRHWKQNHM